MTSCGMKKRTLSRTITSDVKKKKKKIPGWQERNLLDEGSAILLSPKERHQFAEKFRPRAEHAPAGVSTIVLIGLLLCLQFQIRSAVQRGRRVIVRMPAGIGPKFPADGRIADHETDGVGYLFGADQAF